MAKTQDRVLEALSGLVPEDAQDKLTVAVTTLLDEAVADLKASLEADAKAKLDEEVKNIAGEREKDWQTAEQGYKQAYDIISDLRARLARQETEFEESMKEEYESAYQMILDERKKNETLEASLHEAYEKELKVRDEKLVDMVDTFLEKMGEEYYESARREVMNDPYLAEHRMAFEKVIDVVKDYVSEEDVANNTGSKLKDLEQKLESVESTRRQLEQKNMKLMTENHKYQEYLKETKELLEKNLLNEQNARVESAKKVEGRGKTVNEPQREVVIGEAVDRSTTADAQNITSDNDIATQWQVLAGIR